MTYHDYQSFQTKNGCIDVFVMEMEGETFVQMFTTDYRSHATSSATFTSLESFKNFIQILENLEFETNIL